MDGSAGFKTVIAGRASCPNCANSLLSPEALLRAVSRAETETPNISFTSNLSFQSASQESSTSSDDTDVDDDDEDGGVSLSLATTTTPATPTTTVTAGDATPRPGQVRRVRLPGGEPVLIASGTSPFASLPPPRSAAAAADDIEDSASLTTSSLGLGPLVPVPLSDGSGVEYIQLPVQFPAHATSNVVAGMLGQDGPGAPMLITNYHDGVPTVHGAADLPSDMDALVVDPRTFVAPPPSFPVLTGDGPIFEGTPDGPFTVYTFWEEDALPVDDPLRSYDFAEFLNDWRLRAAEGEKRIPTFRPGSRASDDGAPEIGPRPDLVLGHRRRSSRTDIQGIDWRRLGPSREDAIRARREMHPSRNSLADYDSHDEGAATPRAAFAPSSSTPTPSAAPGPRYTFRSFDATHRPHIHHFQLRHNLAALDRNHVYYAAADRVVRTSLALPGLAEPAMDFSHSARGFKVSCLAASPTSPFADEYTSSSRVLIAGGLGGEYTLLNPATGSLTEGIVSSGDDALVTHAHLFPARRSGALHAAFCTNDNSLRVLDVATGRFIAHHTYAAAPNCAATSPDGRLRALVGDDADALITAAEEEGGPVLARLTHHAAPGFACAWRPDDGRVLATAAQDGRVAVWDARRWDMPLKVITPVAACPRSVNWTAAGELVVAEHDDVVRVLDPVEFAPREKMEFFGAVAGVAVLGHGREIVVANADRSVGGLVVWERVGDGDGTRARGGGYGERRDAWAAKAVVREFEEEEEVYDDDVWRTSLHGGGGMSALDLVMV